MLQSLIRAIYPPQCVCCGGLTLEDFALCGSCWSDCPFVAGLACDLCGVPLLGEDRGRPEYCDACLQGGRDWARGRAVGLYDGRLRELVLAFKHGDRTDLARPLGLWMARALSQLVPDGEIPLIIPVPLHPLRLWTRRYNQAALLAQRMGQETGHAVLVDALRRIRRTKPLKEADRAARAAAVAGAFAVHPRHRAAIAGRLVVVVDDVMTSGATLSVAARTLMAAGAGEVRVLVLARRDKAP